MSIERPYVLFAILLIIPAILIMNRKLGSKEFEVKGFIHISRLKSIFTAKIVLRSISWCLLILACAKISWGTHIVPVQKNGTAVSFVFDISNSMLATDCPEKMTRLKAASIYSKKLMEKMKGVPISVVLAKGDGVNTIPITEDYAMIESLLDVISPSLMTTPGSSIGKGVLKAKDSFPVNYSNAGRIWVFTDGEESDSHLKTALMECIKSGIPVSVIGFGQENETEVLAGDGKTTVKTALRKDKVLDIIQSVQKNTGFYKNQIPIIYVNPFENGSAHSLLAQLNSGENQIVTYEAKPVPRYKFFLIMAILLFALSFICTEFDFTRLFRMENSNKASKSTVVLLICLAFIFTGCSSNTTKILQGSYAFGQKQYSKAVSNFLDVAKSANETNHKEALYFSLYDLGTAYSMIEEDQAAMEKFLLIDENASDTVKYATYYNAGIIAHRNGNYEEAIDYFTKALRIDSTQINAKVNLELSISQSEVDVKQKESKITPATQETLPPPPDMEKAVFERIKEGDQKQWKNSEVNQDRNLSDDY